MVVVAALLLLVVAGIGYAIVQTTTTKTPGASRPDGAGVTTTQSARGDAAQVPEVLWNADMEDGSLRAWYAPETSAVGDFGGGEFTSGGGETGVSDAQAHSGRWSAKLTLPTGSGGARLFRWREFRAERDLTQSVCDAHSRGLPSHRRSGQRPLLEHRPAQEPDGEPGPQRPDVVREPDERGRRTGAPARVVVAHARGTAPQPDRLPPLHER